MAGPCIHCTLLGTNLAGGWRVVEAPGRVVHRCGAGLRGSMPRVRTQRAGLAGVQVRSYYLDLNLVGDYWGW